MRFSILRIPCALSAGTNRLFHIKNNPLINGPAALYPLWGTKRNVSNWQAPFIVSMRNRREIEQFNKPPVVVKRNEFLEWNYEAELFAFTQRVGENFDKDLISRAFYEKSFALSEQDKQEELGMAKLEIKHNEDLVKEGREFINQVLDRTLREEFPKFPDEGIKALIDHLTSVPTLSYISSHLGTKDIIFSKTYPPEDETFANVFLAIVGALLKSSGPDRADQFVKDFVLTQICGVDINEIWDIPRPWLMLNEILKKRGEEEPEPRILRQTGRNTIFATYIVGLYNKDKELIGTGIGETLDIAQEMGARDALKGIFGTREPRAPLKCINYNMQMKSLKS